MPVELAEIEVSDFEKSILDELENIAKEMVDYMKSNVQKRSGNTARNITYKMTPKGFIIYGDKKSYAVWHLLEYGTPTARAYPFVRPAIKKFQPEIDKAMAEGLEKSIRIKKI